MPARTTNVRRLILAAAGFVVIADQASKAAALAILGDGERSFGPFRFVIVRNPGGPFGVATGASLAWTVVTLTIVVAALVAVGTDSLRIRPAVAVGAVIGGGIGNLLDRLLRDPGGGRGAVIDWIAFDPYSRVFNLADVALRGAALLLIVAAFAGRPRDTPPAGKRGEGKRVPQATTTRE
jgi:signal peptidase II